MYVRGFNNLNSYKVYLVYSFLIDFCVILFLWSSNLALAGLRRMIRDSNVLNFFTSFSFNPKMSVWQQLNKLVSFFLNGDQTSGRLYPCPQVVYTCLILIIFTAALNLFAQYNDNTNFQQYHTYRPLLLACTTDFILFCVLVPFNKQPATRIPPPQHSNGGEEVLSGERG